MLPMLRSPLPELPFRIDDVSCLEGDLAGDAKPLRGGRFLYPLRISSVTSETGISASARGLIKIISKGDFIYRGSFVKTENPKFLRYDTSKSIYFHSPPVIYAGNTVATGEPESVVFRKKVLEQVNLAISSFDTGDGLAAALLTGNRNNLDPLLAENIKKSGCAHILALSGMHLGILTLFIYFVFRKSAGIRFSIVAALIFSFLFAFMAGMSASLLRAFVFFAVSSLAKLAGRSGSMGRMLVLCFVITILVSPDEAGELSFQYSFMAVAGIIFFTDHIYRTILPFVPPSLSAPFACTIAAQLPSWVLSAAVFNEIYFSGIAASLVLTPLVTIYMLVAFPYMILVIASGISLGLVNNLMGIISSLIHRAASFFALIPSFKTGLFSLSLLIILNLFAIFCVMLPLTNLIHPRILKRYK